MTVVAALIERDGQILITQRKRTGRHPLKWEFPGGKVEPDEDPRDALVRELKEELDIEAEIGGQVDAYEVRYGDSPVIHLLFYRVSNFSGEPSNLDFEQIVWVDPRRLEDFDFLEGDLAFIQKLATNKHE